MQAANYWIADIANLDGFPDRLILCSICNYHIILLQKPLFRVLHTRFQKGDTIRVSNNITIFDQDVAIMNIADGPMLGKLVAGIGIVLLNLEELSEWDDNPVSSEACQPRLSRH